MTSGSYLRLKRTTRKNKKLLKHNNVEFYTYEINAKVQLKVVISGIIQEVNKEGVKDYLVGYHVNKVWK